VDSSNGFATYSPDGTTLAFLHWEPGDRPTVGVDGRHVQVIGLDAQAGGEQHAPIWSPDGSQIAFDQTNADGIAFGYVLDLTTGGTTRIPASVEGWLDQQTLVVGP
jgi:Tol biopolymer transport system component